MIIHVVQAGETINSIADYYKVDVNRLIQSNDIVNPQRLVVGQSILIVYPKQIHTVQEGDSLASIAEEYGITVKELLRYNPQLLSREFIYPGEEIVISYMDDRVGRIATNGYAYPYIDKSILQKNLLYLTYLSVFNYTITEEGLLDEIDDTEIIDLAKSYQVAPIMVISNTSPEGTINRELLHNILNSPEKSTQLIDNILSVLQQKGYYGLNLETSYIRDIDWDLYFDLLNEIKDKLHQEGLKLYVTVSPNTFEQAPAGENLLTLFTALSEISDGIIVLSYSRGYTSEIPFESTSVYLLEILLEFTLQNIPPEKILFGITSIGYIWRLPNIIGESRAVAISNTNAIQLAADTGTEIYYNPYNLSSYFYFKDVDLFLVYFHDVRGVNASLEIMSQYGLRGIGIWNVMYFLAQTFLLIHTLYDIEEV